LNEEKKKYRRLKWFAFEHVPIKRGFSIGEVLLTDRWGNEFRWAPEWKNISLLLLEALKTEIANKPQGAWAQVFRDLARLSVTRIKSKKAPPEYPEIIEELMDMVYLGSYLNKRFPSSARVLRNVRLGPTKWLFMKCPKCHGSSVLIGTRKAQETIEGLFRCQNCYNEFCVKT